MCGHRVKYIHDFFPIAYLNCYTSYLKMYYSIAFCYCHECFVPGQVDWCNVSMGFIQHPISSSFRQCFTADNSLSSCMGDTHACHHKDFSQQLLHVPPWSCDNNRTSTNKKKKNIEWIKPSLCHCTRLKKDSSEKLHRRQLVPTPCVGNNYIQLSVRHELNQGSK